MNWLLVDCTRSIGKVWPNRCASVGLSPAVAWLTLVSSWNEKRRERHVSIRRRLVELREEVDRIGNWAQTQYTSESDATEWKNPFWQVLDFPSTRLAAFNAEFSPSDVGRALSDALVQIEVSISAFRDLPNQHRQFVKVGFDRYSKPNTEDTSKIIFQPPKDWISELHRLNQKIHVQGIGDGCTKLGLHSTWKKASSELQDCLNSLRKRRKPRVMWIGHLLAIILGLAGFLFLLALIFELLNQMICGQRPYDSACSCR